MTSVGEVTEVPEQTRRRAFTVEYKRKIVKEAESCKGPGEIGALLRREGLFSSHLTTCESLDRSLASLATFGPDPRRAATILRVRR